MEATQPPNPPTFETVWAGFQEIRQIMKEGAERHEREMKESAERHEREMKESAERHEREMKEGAERHEREMKESAEQRAEQRKEFEREMKKLRQETEKSNIEFNQKLGKYIILFGEITEYTMAPKLREKFIEFGFDFHKTNREISVRDSVNDIFFEVDVMLENGDTAMLVDIKTNLTFKYINNHITRIEKMRKYADLRGDKRAFLGAVAGVVVEGDARKYALDQGFYLIEPSGESISITPPNGKPKEW